MRGEVIYCHCYSKSTFLFRGIYIGCIATVHRSAVNKARAWEGNDDNSNDVWGGNGCV